MIKRLSDRNDTANKIVADIEAAGTNERIYDQDASWPSSNSLLSCAARRIDYIAIRFWDDCSLKKCG